MVKKYVKKPIQIEAVQWTGDNFKDLYNFAGNDVYFQDGWIYVHTLEGDMKMVNKTGDYLIKGIRGEFYFCEKNIFEETYEEVKHKDLSDMKYGDAGITYIPYIPVQVTDKKNVSKFEKAIKESIKHECHTKYKTLEDVEKHNDEVKHKYQVLTLDQHRELGRQRIDESKNSEWQCPTCKHRVKNLQRQQTKDGNPCWGCQKFCDTLDATYFNGKACKLYEEGHSGWVWW